MQHRMQGDGMMLPMYASLQGLFYTVVYYAVAFASLGGLAWMLWMDRTRDKQSEQRRRGLCPNCGYDLRASKDRCPECGKLIHPKSDLPY
jgi:hypothetical protein